MLTLSQIFFETWEMSRPSNDCSIARFQRLCDATELKSRTNPAQHFIDTGSSMWNTFHKLIKLVHKISDVDAAHGESLGKG